MNDGFLNEGAVIPRKRLCLLGGDKRQRYMARLFSLAGFDVNTFAVPCISESGNSQAFTAEIPRNTLNSTNGETAQSLSASVCEEALQGTACFRAEDAAKLRQRGEVRDFPSAEEALSGCDVLVLPFPVSPDGITLNCSAAVKPKLAELFSLASGLGVTRVFGGAFKDGVLRLAEVCGLCVTDYGENEGIALKNAVPTAEGAVEIAMRELDVTIHGSRMAVLGYGRCGSVLARLLLGMGAEVRGVARSERDRAKMYADGVQGYSFAALNGALCGCDAVFNTAPAEVLGEAALRAVSPGTPIIDLASAPGGVDRASAAALGIKVIHALSLPGKYSPMSAAKIICETLIPLLSE